MTPRNQRPEEAEPSTRRRPQVAGSRGRARRALEESARAREVSPDPTDVSAVATEARPVPVEPARARRVARPNGKARRSRHGSDAASGTALPPAGARPFRSGWPLTVALVLLAALVALGTTVALLGVKAHRQAATDRARSAALAAARTQAELFLSYDYRTLDRDFDRAKAGLTGAFAQEYGNTTNTVVRPTATQYQAVVTADVISLSVVDAEPNRVVVLAFVDQTTTSNRLSGPRVDQNRVEMTLVPVRGAWKVSAVQAL